MMMSGNPVFVTGPDRSGTSLMFALLASHPNISMVRRSNIWRWFHGQFGDLSVPENFERCFEAMLNYKRLDVLQPDPERIRQEFLAGDDKSYGRLFALFHGHHAERMGKPRWGDKSLHTELYADAVFQEFPDAKMIHMLRDPRDRYASVLKRYDGNDDKGITSSTGRWRNSTRMGKRNLQKYPDKYITVRYETLASEPEKTCREVCAFLGEKFEPYMMSMKGAPDHGEVGGNSSFENFEPGTISTKSIGRFRTVLDPQHIAFIQTATGRDMVSFDYPLEPVQLSSGDRAKYYLVDLPKNYIRMAGWIAVNNLANKRGRGVPKHRQRNGKR